VGFAPLAVVLTNTSTGNFAAGLWRLGDGLTSTLKHPGHTYTAAGAFTVTLTASGPAGTDTFTRTNYIRAQKPYVVDLPLILCKG